MPLILVAADADWVHDDVRSSLVGPGYEVLEVRDGMAVSGFVARQRPDLAIIDMQIGNMGGFAVARDLRLEESAGRAPHVPVLLLLDRAADVFLARRASVDTWLVKPFDPGTLRRAVRRLLAGEEPVDAATSVSTDVAVPAAAGGGAPGTRRPARGRLGRQPTP